MASRVCATRNPPVNALTMAWSAAPSGPSRSCSIATVDGRWRETIRAVAIHSHCAGPSTLAAATRNCPASDALSGLRPAREACLWPAASRWDGSRDVAGRDQLDAGPHIANLGDHVAVPITLEHHDGQLLDRQALGLRDPAQVPFDRHLEVDDATRAAAHHELLHVMRVRGEHRPPLGEGDDRNRPW